jgi:hypothetical protein
VDRDIAERANELCRLQTITPGVKQLRPNDAIHLACAERANCEVLLSYDKDLTQQKHDSISIEWPQPLVVMPTQMALVAPPAVQTAWALSAPTEEADESAVEEVKEINRVESKSTEALPKSVESAEIAPDSSTAPPPPTIGTEPEAG